MLGYEDTTLFQTGRLQLERLDIAALIGPNGSGKSTFLRTAAPGNIRGVQFGRRTREGQKPSIVADCSARAPQRRHCRAARAARRGDDGCTARRVAEAAFLHRASNPG
jgi:ATPase subunit of ABC transporter with duplicated ATPase domains